MIPWVISPISDEHMCVPITRSPRLRSRWRAARPSSASKVHRGRPSATSQAGPREFGKPGPGTPGNHGVMM